MPAIGSATETAFLIIAVIQAVFALIWACGAWWVISARRAIWHWAIWSALGCVTWGILAAEFQSPPLIGVLIGMSGAIFLQRGIRLFIGHEPAHRLHAVLLLVVVAASTLPAQRRYIQTTIDFSVLAWLYFDIARDLYRHAHVQLRFRWPIVLALPVLLGAIGWGSRAVRALLWPDSVLSEMVVDSSLNVASALTYVVLVLSLHATLIALVVGRLIDELRKLSMHDALTGLLNRRAIEETLHAQFRSSRRSGESFVVMMLDLDYFKRINDEFGHATGDLALKHVSALLLSALRDIDRLARFGGEEFVVLMPGATLAQAKPIAERLRALLVANPLLENGKQVPLSVSIGIAQWHGNDDDAPLLLQRADAALFQAKVQGRNRVASSATQTPIFQA
jgi:diguanylate cyclase (GGDEF)-like protein